MNMASLRHPVQAAAEAMGSAGIDPRVMQRTSFFQGANDGPAKHAARIAGVVDGVKAQDDGAYFTNNEGIPFPDVAHSKTVGGLPLVSDVFLLQKQQHFNRSKNLERMVHPCGSGAFGHFEVTHDVSQYTKASFLQSVGKKTPIFTRFSTVTLGREFPDLARNPRGFAVKFYTEEGNYDIVGLNFPIFFCRDPIQGPDVIRSQARRPDNFLLDYNATFDLLANTPEANHAGLMFFSDHGTPDGWTHFNGYGCHTFKWVNSEGKFVYIKYHFEAEHGQKQFTADEATKWSGLDPDYSKRQLWQTIERGDQPTWVAKVQIMQPEEASFENLGFDPFDVTKVWPKKRFPLHDFGKLTLTKNPENFHRDVELAAFSPGSMVPGIEESPDALLQFRMFFYRDAQYHRVGVNLHQQPVNCPFMAKSYSSINFDGPMRTDGNHSGNPDYNPNSTVFKFRPDTAETPYAVSDNIVSRKSHYSHEATLSEYDQARDLYRNVMTETAREHTHSNTARLMNLVDSSTIKQKYLSQQFLIAPEYAKGIYQLLEDPGFDFDAVEHGAKDAEKAYKAPKFRPSNPTDTMIGTVPPMQVYNL